MDLLERYLQAVGQHLPARTRLDTLAELRENLLAQIEAREEELGRPLTQAEVASVLEAHGRPVLVAAQYQSQQYLIGPGLFPIYSLTMKKSLPLVLLAYATAQAVGLIFQKGSFDVWAAIGHLPFALLTFWGCVTLAFALFEFAQGRYFAEIKVSNRWNPNDLPPLAVPGKRPSLASGIADVAVHVVGIAWLFIIPYKPYLLLGPGLGYIRGLHVGLTPEWHVFYWQIMALLILMLPLKALALYTPLSRWRDGLQIAQQVLGIGILAVLLQARSYFAPAAALSAHDLGSLAGVNALIHLGFEIGLAVRIFKLLWDLWKMIAASTVPRTGGAMV
ncbi:MULTISPECIES: hypothetical protein [Acidobacteriaceae]|uniref:hypothetical protein n=1 Tax=Acidobacteriaceae TaxID=204434 RepID=UPI00131DE038|nr:MULTISPECIES: hypothetical protein [Acidobacteriaceae]MDW5265685.1 hypothetical protein [Edaphobacter sp.]